ncbi:hypothetical protein PM082_024039 [Marasmius tenuissimus]|nr:hypothetical protein PM082_024039 [Marasmius tenuissimus]
MRPLVRDAVKTSLAVARSTKKQDEVEKATKKGRLARKTEDADDSEPPSLLDKHASKAKEFQIHSTSAPKQSNDTIQAPPEMLCGAEKVLGRTGDISGTCCCLPAATLFGSIPSLKARLAHPFRRSPLHGFPIPHPKSTRNTRMVIEHDVFLDPLSSP